MFYSHSLTTFGEAQRLFIRNLTHDTTKNHKGMKQNSWTSAPHSASKLAKLSDDWRPFSSNLLGHTTKFQWVEMAYSDRITSGSAQSFHQTESTTSQNRAIAYPIAGAELYRIHFHRRC